MLTCQSELHHLTWVLTTARAIVAGVRQALQDMQQKQAGTGKGCLGMLLLPIASAILWLLW